MQQELDAEKARAQAALQAMEELVGSIQPFRVPVSTLFIDSAVSVSLSSLAALVLPFVAHDRAKVSNLARSFVALCCTPLLTVRSVGGECIFGFHRSGLMFICLYDSK